MRKASGGTFWFKVAGLPGDFGSKENDSGAFWAVATGVRLVAGFRGAAFFFFGFATGDSTSKFDSEIVAGKRA